MVFPVVIYGYESWRKLSAEELMLLNCGVGEDSWESLGLQGDPTSQILKEISPKYSLEGLMLKLKLQFFGYLMRRTYWKSPDAGKDWRQEEKGTTEDEIVGWHHWCDGQLSRSWSWSWEFWVGSRSWRWTGKPGVLWSTGSQRVGHEWATEHGNLLQYSCLENPMDGGAR